MIRYIKTPQKKKIKKEQERRKKSGAPACGPTLESRNPTAADADNDGHKHHQNENHEHGVTSHELQNGVEPRQHRSENGGDIRDKGGKSTSGRRRQTFSFPIRLFMVNEP